MGAVAVDFELGWREDDDRPWLGDSWIVRSRVSNRERNDALLGDEMIDDLIFLEKLRGVSKEMEFAAGAHTFCCSASVVLSSISPK